MGSSIAGLGVGSIGGLGVELYSKFHFLSYELPQQHLAEAHVARGRSSCEEAERRGGRSLLMAPFHAAVERAALGATSPRHGRHSDAKAMAAGIHMSSSPSVSLFFLSSLHCSYLLHSADASSCKDFTCVATTKRQLPHASLPTSLSCFHTPAPYATEGESSYGTSRNRVMNARTPGSKAHAHTHGSGERQAGFITGRGEGRGIVAALAWCFTSSLYELRIHGKSHIRIGDGGDVAAQKLMAERRLLRGSRKRVMEISSPLDRAKQLQP
nr:unnamed protein product [Digitaria exilis]